MVNQLGANSTDRITIANPDSSKNATTPAESGTNFHKLCSDEASFV